MKVYSTDQGFTLVEIIIVIVIIGLLAVIAVPVFQKVRTSSLEKTVLNDGRQIGAAAQQYMMENAVTQVDVTITNGVVTGSLTAYIKQISAKTRLSLSPIEANNTTNAFQLTTPDAFGGNPSNFNSEGMKTN